MSFSKNHVKLDIHSVLRMVCGMMKPMGWILRGGEQELCLRVDCEIYFNQ